MSNQPKQFAIAKSSTGTIGLITSSEKTVHTYPDGNTVEVWTGIVIESNSFLSRDKTKQINTTPSDFWSSSNPNVIGELDLSEMNTLPRALKQALECHLA